MIESRAGEVKGMVGSMGEGGRGQGVVEVEGVVRSRGSGDGRWWGQGIVGVKGQGGVGLGVVEVWWWGQGVVGV